MEQYQGGVLEKKRTELKEPKRYKVIMHNDDVTTFEFVIKVLVQVFRKTVAEAENTALFIHEKGAAVLGVFSYDMALTKKDKATGMARKEGFPLQLSVTPEDE